MNDPLSTLLHENEVMARYGRLFVDRELRQARRSRMIKWFNLRRGPHYHASTHPPIRRHRLSWLRPSQGVPLPLRIRFNWRFIIEHPAQINEMFLRARALLEARIPPLGDEILRRHRWPPTCDTQASIALSLLKQAVLDQFRRRRGFSLIIAARTRKSSARL